MSTSDVPIHCKSYAGLLMLCHLLCCYYARLLLQVESQWHANP